MSDRALPDRPLYRDLFWPTLKAIQGLGGSATRQEVFAKAIEIGGYSEDQQAAVMPNGRTSRLAYYVSWSLTDSSASAWWITANGESGR